MQIVKPVPQHLCRLRGIALAQQVKSDQGRSHGIEESRAQQRQCRADQHFKPEGVADTLMVMGAKELGGKNARTGAGTEDAQIVDEQQTVDDGNAAHLQASHLSDHDVVQHGDKVGNAVLNDDRNGDDKEALKQDMLVRAAMKVIEDTAVLKDAE